MPERADLNVHFKTCDTTYEQQFARMVEDGAISLRGLKADAKVFDELVFDVNSAYFENHGGYDYAKEFFAEAYRLAVQEAGGEEYILSAVMHADERNKALSEQMGRDIFHYHLHVIYVPVVDKEVKWTKRCKDPALVGTVKEVIKQVSHSKKWPKFKQFDEQGNPVLSENGKMVMLNSYSLLQDRFHDHMRAAGFEDFERGTQRSTRKHLDDLDYKIQQDKIRSAALDEAIADKTDAVAVLDGQAEKKQARLDALDKKTAVVRQESAAFADIDRMGEKKTLGGNIQLSPADWKTVSGLAKEGVKSRGIIAEMKKKISDFVRKITGLEKRLQGYEGKSITDTMQYYQAQQRAPRRLAEVIADVFRKPPEQQQQRDKSNDKRRTQDHEI